MTQDASKFVGSIPDNYDNGLVPHIFADYAVDLARRVADLDPRSVLELAAGTGVVTRHLRDTLDNDCALIASDLNAPMLDVAKGKFSMDEVVEFQTVDAMDLHFDDESFDAIVCQFGVMFFPDKNRSYTEAARVLKAGGSYVFNVWGSLDDNPFAKIATDVAAQFFPDDPPGFYKVPFGYYDADLIRESLLASGFASAEATDVHLTKKDISAELFARGLVFGNPFQEDILKRGGDPNEVHERLSAAIASELGAEMPLKAIVIHARK